MHGFWSKLKEKNPKIVFNVADCYLQRDLTTRIRMATVTFVLGSGRVSHPWRSASPFFETRIRNDLVAKESATPSKKGTTATWPYFVARNPGRFFTGLVTYLQPRECVPASREHLVPTE